MAVHGFQLVTTVVEIVEHAANRRMFNRAIFIIRNQVLLTDIGDIAAFRIFREEMIKRLITPGPDFGRDRIIPFFAVGKDGINVENDSAKFEQAVADDVSNPEIGARNRRSPDGVGTV